MVADEEAEDARLLNLLSKAPTDYQPRAGVWTPELGDVTKAKMRDFFEAQKEGQPMEWSPPMYVFHPDDYEYFKSKGWIG